MSTSDDGALPDVVIKLSAPREAALAVMVRAVSGGAA